MGQDVKIGIAVGLVVAVLAVVWFAMSGDGDKQPVGQPDGDSVVFNQDPAETTGPESSGPLEAYPTGAAEEAEADDVVIPRIEVDDETSADEERAFDPDAGPGLARETETTADTDAEARADGDAEFYRRIQLPDGPDLDSDTDTDRETTDERWTDTTDDREGAGSIGRPVADDDDDVAGPVGPVTMKIYEVVEGDAGFWGIAAKEYGHGKYGTLIAKANPGVDSTTLRPGQKIKIPPLPREPSTEEIERERLASAPVGSRAYTVQADDSEGFWGISQKLYGTSRYVRLLEKANPGVEATRLRAGMVLVVPPRPDERGTSPVREEAGEDDVVVEGGRRIYTVQAGDLGFWEIAKKMYGKGGLWPAIQEANPGVDPERLQAGQKIVVPSKADAERMVGVESDTGVDTDSDVIVVPVRRREEAGDDEPLFD
ncbi:MAG: LysM peptidoglycan-binding domain-containing protein [Planctomycetota bacterium]|jgi:nucleoid-associated protein YgaU